MEETITQYIANVLQRAPDEGEVATWEALIDAGEMTLEGVRDAIVRSAEAQNDVYPVILTYQAVFGRVPDQEGLEYWTEVFRAVDNDTELLAAQFVGADVPEFSDRFGDNPTGAQFVAASYQNILGRPGDAAGLAYWTGVYDDVREDAAQNNPDWTDEQLSDHARAVTLNQFVISPEYVENTAAAVEGFLADAADEVEGAYEGSLWDRGDGVPGETFTLTSGVDEFQGTADNDLFRAFEIDGEATLQTFDTIDGGAGRDTLNIAQGAIGDSETGPASAAPVITNVEVINNSHVGAAVAADHSLADKRVVLDLANVAGVEELWTDFSNVTWPDTGDVHELGTNGIGVTYENASSDTVFGVSNVGAMPLNSDGDEIQGYANISFGNASGTLNLALSNNDEQSLVRAGTAADFDTVNIDVAAGNSGTIQVGRSVESITITGEGDLAIRGGISYDELTSVDAGSATGSIHFGANDTDSFDDATEVVNNTRLGEDFSIVMGSGNDTVDLRGVTTDGTIDLGAGNDTFIGGSGDEVIIAGTGQNTLTGDDGDDTFILTVKGTTIGSLDTITDFNHSETEGDSLFFGDVEVTEDNLGELDGSVASNYSELRELANNSFTDDISFLIGAYEDSASFYLFYDEDGDGVADAAVELESPTLIGLGLDIDLANNTTVGA